jgi:large subunit ribosomal protein L28
MSRTCDICSKHTASGGKITRRGIAKKKGGIGLRVTSHTKRKFKANIQKVRILSADGKTASRARVCTRCLKAGKVRKR